MQVPLAEAIEQLRDELRRAVVEGKDKDILFVPKLVELELVVTFGAEAKTGGGFKLLAMLDLSAEIKATRSNQHKLKLQFEVTDAHGNPILVRSDIVPNP
jgi:hypothetical protein